MFFAHSVFDIIFLMTTVFCMGGLNVAIYKRIFHYRTIVFVKLCFFSSYSNSSETWRTKRKEKSRFLRKIRSGKSEFFNSHSIISRFCTHLRRRHVIMIESPMNLCLIEYYLQSRLIRLFTWITCKEVLDICKCLYRSLQEYCSLFCPFIHRTVLKCALQNVKITMKIWKYFI